MIKLQLKGLKRICELLDVERSGTKDDLVERILDYLLEPKQTGRKVTAKRSTTAGRAKRGPKGGKKSKAKTEGGEDEEEGDDDEESEGNENEEDEEGKDEEMEEEEEKEESEKEEEEEKEESEKEEEEEVKPKGRKRAATKAVAPLAKKKAQPAPKPGKF